MDVQEVYTLFEELRRLMKEGNEAKSVEIIQPDFSAIGELSGELEEVIKEARL